jgi:hypothetical protein
MSKPSNLAYMYASSSLAYTKLLIIIYFLEQLLGFNLCFGNK